ncbi:MAG: D-aminoacylase [Capsulimonadaceae bacterium]|nr:D-aminoacylase [Capsulimonadaceae bacterium]
MVNEPGKRLVGDAQADYVLTGGTVYDGLGGPPVQSDVAIRGDRIVDIASGLASKYAAARQIDVTGLSVTPGFIDIHTHSDISVLVNPLMESSVHQGVTTEVVGNCGMSIASTLPTAEFAFERSWLERSGLQMTWGSFAGFLRAVEEQGVAINICSQTGHGTLRKQVIGVDDRPPSPSELTRMQSLVESAMSDGAVGLSTGLEYLPGGYANLDEIVALASVAHAAGGFYSSHIRNEGDTLLESVDEAIAVGKRTGIPVQVSHLKAEGRKNWGKVSAVLQHMDDARKAGFDVLTDQYPYTAFMTGLQVVLLPKWAMAGTIDDMLERLSNSTTRTQIRDEILRNPPDWTKIQIAVSRKRRDTQGLTLERLGAREGKHPLDAALDLLLDEGGWLAAAHFALSETDLETVLRDPHTMIGSDGVSTAPRGALAEDQTHPRTYGTFPRVLASCVRDRGIIPLAEAIRRMTSLPAGRIGLRDRGRLAVGMKADVTVFKAGEIADVATFETPHKFAVGIEYVFVNGRIALENGVQRDVRPGRVLRRENGAVA